MKLAAKGYIVVAPDLLSGFGPMAAEAASSSGRSRREGLSPRLILTAYSPIWMQRQITRKRFRPATVKSPPSASAGGGGKSFAFAAHRKDLSAPLSFLRFRTGPT